MSQIRLFFSEDKDVARTIGDLLFERFDEGEFPVSVFETNEDSGIWAVSLYVETEDADRVETEVQEFLSLSGYPNTFEREIIEETDWVTKTLQDLAPVRAGRFIVHGSHDNDVPKSHEHSVIIDAGQAFGTGHHGTTAGCLDMLGECLKRRNYNNALDIGTGSGVLAIALAKALPIKILASDIDPIATKTASDNTRINNVASQINCITATGFNHRGFADAGPFDLIIANILARPLQDLAHPMRAYLAPRATVILSGLLPHQKARICATYRLQGLKLEKTHIRNGWLTLVLTK
ncbi:MAG: 50S ribosomal protein L11 methyltransferase [Hyphomicrobiales bacterium]|nr:MAG: 50S ribosomal protein L11 methyltransferase [Hyphomicrobiales bacterium]